MHIQYSYDDRSIVVVNSTYERVAGLHASVHVHNVAWKELYSDEAAVDAGVDSSQIVFTIPESLYHGAERTFFIDLTLTDGAGKVVSRNFYWVPGTLTTFDWQKTDYTHTPAARHEDLTALANLPAAEVVAHAEIGEHGSWTRTARGNSELRRRLWRFRSARPCARSPADLIAPVIWSDNWIELVPGEKRVLTALLPEDVPAEPMVQIEGWNAEIIGCHADRSRGARSS